MSELLIDLSTVYTYIFGFRLVIHNLAMNVIKFWLWELSLKERYFHSHIFGGGGGGNDYSMTKWKLMLLLDVHAKSKLHIIMPINGTL